MMWRQQYYWGGMISTKTHIDKDFDQSTWMKEKATERWLLDLINKWMKECSSAKKSMWTGCDWTTTGDATIERMSVGSQGRMQDIVKSGSYCAHEKHFVDHAHFWFGHTPFQLHLPLNCAAARKTTKEPDCSHNKQDSQNNVVSHPESLVHPIVFTGRYYYSR